MKLSTHFTQAGTRQKWIVVTSQGQKICATREAAELLLLEPEGIRICNPHGETLVTKNSQGELEYHHITQQELDQGRSIND